MRLNLKIVRIDEIKPLMSCRERDVDHLQRIIERTGSIRNPFFLASSEKDGLLLLDDAVHLKVARRLQLPCVPAQVIHLKKSLKIKASMFATGLKKSYIDDFQGIFPRSMVMTAAGCPEPDPGGWTRIFVSNRDEGELCLYFRKTSTGFISPDVLNFFDYLDYRCALKTGILPVTTRVSNIKRLSDNCLIEVANITADDLLFVCRQNYLFPSGLLKFSSSCRIMGIDFPVSVLRESVSVREKERFLIDLLNYRVNSGFPTYLRSGVYLLNY
jgi:hypothetical protein